jgi:hypothetical protein
MYEHLSSWALEFMGIGVHGHWSSWLEFMGIGEHGHLSMGVVFHGCWRSFECTESQKPPKVH